MTNPLFRCCLVLFALSASAVAEQVTFTFAPVDGTRWLRVGEDRALRDMGMGAPITETSTRQEVEIVYRRNSSGGWQITQTPRSIVFEIDGIPTPNPILDLTLGAEIVLKTDDSGLAQSVTGFRQLLRKLEDNLPVELFANVSRSFDETTMGEGEKKRWDGELGGLRGATVTLGERWHVVETRPFAMGGSIPVEGVMRFEGWAEVDGLRGFKVAYDWDSTGEALAQFGQDDMKLVDLRSPDEAPAGGNLVMSGSELRVIVPETGQLLYRTNEEVAALQEVESIGSALGSTDGRFEDRSTYRWRRLED